MHLFCTFRFLKSFLLLFWTAAVANIFPEKKGGIEAKIVFKQQKGGILKITGTITGLTQGSHGFHVHEIPDTSDQCRAAGGHFNPSVRFLKKSHKKTHFDIYDFTLGFYTWQNMCRRKPRGWFRQHPSKWWWRSQYRNLHSTWVSNYAFWWQHHNWSHSGHSRRCGWFGPRQQVRCRFINLQKSWNLETLFILKTFTQKSLQFALWITLNFVIR